MAIHIVAPHYLANVFGILGNIVSFMVYLAPLPTFYRIYKKKSTEGFQSIPYAVALFSAMFMLYYASVKGENTTLIYTINSIGCVIEGTYLLIYMIYASKKVKMDTAKLLILLNVGVYGLIILFTMSLSHAKQRAKIVGWICAVFSVCVFASPLSVMRRVIKTRSVEFMPFWLSFSLTLCAVMWFFYGFLIHDPFIAVPNVLGFMLGIAQMMLYWIYQDARRPEVNPEEEIPEEVKLEDTPTVEIKLSTTINDKVDDEEEEKPKEATRIVIEKVANGFHV